VGSQADSAEKPLKLCLVPFGWRGNLSAGVRRILLLRKSGSGVIFLSPAEEPERHVGSTAPSYFRQRASYDAVRFCGL
jgi:hypothetical protein